MLSVEMLANFGDSIARKCKVEYLPYHMGNLVIYQQMVMVGGVFDIAIRGCRTHKLPLVEPRTVRRFYLDRHISGIHLVKDIAEWGNVHRRFIERVHAVIDRYISHVMLWKKDFQI